MSNKVRKGKFTDRELVQLARQAEKAKQKVEKAKQEEAALKKQVLDEMQLRGTKAIEHDGTRLTFVQAERVHYDEQSLYGLLTPAQRRMVFNENVDLNALPAKTRKAVMEVVPKSQRLAVTTRSLDVSALSQATQSGSIDVEVANSVSEVVPSAPYYRLSEF